MDKVETYRKLLHINQALSELDVFPSLGWVWCFDILNDVWTNNRFEDVKDDVYSGECIPEGLSLREIFEKFCDDIDNLGINMDMGGEILEETIMDWMRENGFLVAMDNDAWLDGEEINA